MSLDKKKSESLNTKKGKTNMESIIQAISKAIAPFPENEKIIANLKEVLLLLEKNKNKNLEYDRKWRSAHHLIPMDEISVDLKNFQNRKMPWSEYSVEGITQSVKKGEFIEELFDPIVLWKEPKSKKLYVLAGHSRLEAFFRLEKMSLEDISIQQWSQQNDFYFDKIPSVIIDNIDFQNAKTIALMSNTLASIETDGERVSVYQNMREIGKSPAEIEEFGKRCEKSNRSRIKAYSYLDPNGFVMDTLYAFESGGETTLHIKRLAHRIGELKRKNPELSTIHERELFNRLIEGKKYGKKKGQICNMAQFISTIETHLQEIKNRGEFDPNLPLNLEKRKDISLALQYYYKTLEEINTSKKKIMSEFHIARRELSQKRAISISDNGDRDIFATLEKQLKVSLNKLGNIDDLLTASDFLFDPKDFQLSMEDERQMLEKRKEAILSELRRIEENYYSFKNKLATYIEFGKQEIKMDF